MGGKKTSAKKWLRTTQSSTHEAPSSASHPITDRQKTTLSDIFRAYFYTALLLMTAKQAGARPIYLCRLTFTMYGADLQSNTSKLTSELGTAQLFRTVPL